MWDHIDGSDPAPKDVDSLSKWEMKDAWDMTWIFSSVKPHHVFNLRPHKTVADMWNHLSKVYKQDNTARVFQLEFELAKFAQGSLSIEKCFSGFQHL